jgi:hypothetical protein
MKIYQNRTKTRNQFSKNVLKFFLFLSVTFFCLSFLSGTVELSDSTGFVWERLLLLIPTALFSYMAYTSFRNFRMYFKFLKIKQPVLAVSNKGLTKFDLPNRQSFIPWNKVGEIEFRRYGFQANTLIIKDKEGKASAQILLNSLDVKSDPLLQELKKHTKLQIK